MVYPKHMLRGNKFSGTDPVDCIKVLVEGRWLNRKEYEEYLRNQKDKKEELNE